MSALHVYLCFRRVLIVPANGNGGVDRIPRCARNDKLVMYGWHIVT
jgi:hypothetical protein